MQCNSKKEAYAVNIDLNVGGVGGRTERHKETV